MEENAGLNFILHHYIFILDRDSKEDIEKERSIYIMRFVRDSTRSQNK